MFFSNCKFSNFLKIDKDKFSLDLVRPVPWQLVQSIVVASIIPYLNLWRDISSKPNEEILPTCILALSILRLSLILFSTRILFFLSSISIKSITINPARSRILNCLAISSAASIFVLKAVSSIPLSLVALPEFTSIATNASVVPITIYPPDLSWTVGLNIPDKYSSTLKKEKMGILSSYFLIFFE